MNTLAWRCWQSKECGLELHQDKRSIVYCRDANRKAMHPVVQFTFPGYTSAAKSGGQVWPSVRELLRR